jgi:putative ABC transport system permease protein
LDTLFEILSSLKKNKLRTVLTGFSVSWGIFMLVVLLGSGNGLMNGIKSNFSDRANNVIRIYSGWTNIAYNGYERNRHIKLIEEDVAKIKMRFDEHIEAIVPVVRKFGTQISTGTDYSTTRIEGVKPEYATIEGIKVLAGKGRFINEHDVNERRKVIVLHPRTVEILFADNASSTNHINEYVNINGIPFQIVGIYDADEQAQERGAYIPFSTGQIIFNSGEEVDPICLIIKNLTTKEKNEKFENELQIYLSQLKSFSPKDDGAVWIWNRFSDYLQTQFIFSTITMAIWVIGLFTLLSGIVGVGNIMLISVKERTKEFGIRKAIGASPWTILKSVLLESILITSIFGYIGMLAGIGLTETVNYVMEMQSANSGGGQEMSIFKNPTIDTGIAIGATVVLIIAGTLAGFFPARKAVTIKPVEALNAK